MKVNWMKSPFYIVTERTYKSFDRRRQCFYCHGPFEVGDEVAVANTDEGNKLLHDACAADWLISVAPTLD